MKKYYFSVEDNKLIDSDGAFSADERSRPQSTLGQKDTINIQFVNNKTLPLVDYTKFLSGTVARFLVDVDYLNAGVLIPLGNTGWSLSSGAEYKKILSIKPNTVELDGVDSSEGTVGALSAGEWGYIELSTEIVVRLSDDTDPSTKDDDFVQVLYINASATPLFIEASSDVFNLPDSWLDDDGKTLRNPDITAGEVSFFLNSNTVNFYNRLGGSAKEDGFAEVQFFEPATSLFFMKAKFNYTCTNRLLTSGEDPLELVGVDVYLKAESDTRYVRQALSTAYSEQATVLGTELLFVRDGSTSKQTTINKIKTYFNLDSNEITGTGTVNMRTDVQFPATYNDGVIYTIGAGVTAITDGTTTVNVNEQSTAIVINTTVAKASIDLSSDINLIAKQNLNPTFESIQFDTSVSTPSHSEGLRFWDKANGTTSLMTGFTGVSLQDGQELYILIYNDSGVQIDNGKICYLSGGHTGLFNGETITRPTIDLASNDSASTALPTKGFATANIANGAWGFITKFGLVRDLDTSGCSANETLYLDTSGDYTNTIPSAPNYKITVGSCNEINASTGSILADFVIGNNTNDVINIFNGNTQEVADIAVSSDGAIVTMSLEKMGGGDLSLFFDGAYEVFDTTPVATVALTAGSDTSPTRNYIYIPKSTKVLTTNTSGFPINEQIIPVADIIVPSATYVQASGIYKAHQWSDHVANSVGQGHISHVNNWIRHQSATWLSGVFPTFSGSGTGTINMSSTAGQVLQLHEHTFPVKSSPATFLVINDSVTPYTPITNLGGDILSDSTGSGLGNSTYALVVWGEISEEGEVSNLFVNLPSGSYGSPALARSDLSGYTNTSIPSDYTGTGFLIWRLILSTNPGQTTFTIDSDNSDDLRGKFPNVSAAGGGGGGGGGTEFADNVFRIQNVSDTTKEISFDASSIATSTTRTITMPDNDVDLGNIGATAETTGTVAASGTVNIVVLDTTTSISSAHVDFRIYDATSTFELAKGTTVFESENFSSPVGASSYSPSDFTFATDTSGTDIRFLITNNTANTVNYGWRILNSSEA